MPTQLVIQSKDRLPGGSPSEFRVQIPTFAHTGEVALLSATIPNTLYNVYDANDTLSWSRGGTDYSVQIPHGAYGISDILPVLGAMLSGADTGAGYNASYSPVTMKVTLTSTDPTFYLRLSAQTNSIWRILGWTTTTDTAPALTQTGDSVLRLDFPAHLYLDIGLPSANIVNTEWKRSNYIVPMENISQYVQIYNRMETWDQLQCYSLGAGVSSLLVRLMRPDGTLADLNGAEWTCVIGIERP